MLLELPECLGPLIYQFSFWVPPTQYEEVVKGERITRVTEIFSHARERVGTQAGRGKLYPPAKNVSEQSNIRAQFEARVNELDIGHLFPYSRGYTGVWCQGFATPPANYWEGKPHMEKPDGDNFVKQPLDALNRDKKTGFIGAWPDDCWAIPFPPLKFYGAVPGCQVTLYWFETPNMVKPAKPRKRGPHAS